MPVIVLIVVLLLAILGPQLWARWTLARYAGSRDDIPGTGGELARHLLDQARMQHVTVEKTDLGDHYDPVAKAVRLTADRFDGKSLTAVVVAAHEVGHAIQDQIGYGPLRLRTRLVAVAAVAERCGAVALIALPFVTVLTRAPAIGLVMLIVGMAIMLVPVAMHAATLPVEFDASFRRALPVLAMGYVPAEEMPAARRILTACALTYVAAALASLLNFWRWIRVLRR